MVTFIKTQIALIIGSLADFGVTLLLVELAHAPYVIGNLAGNICGAMMQFILCRGWVFNATEKGIHAQIFKFVLVYAGNLLLSAAGIYFFTHFLGIHYIISKLITSIALGLSYNYWMQKQFVFRTQ